MSMFETFDKSEIYHEQIEPLMKKINDICGEHNIPCLMSIVCKWDEGDDTCSHVIGITANCRDNPIDALHIVFSDILHDYPKREKLIKFARVTLMADMISDLAVDLGKKENEAENKDEENEAE